MAWYDKELYAYNHRSEEEKAEERRQDNFWWAQFLHHSAIRYQKRHQPRERGVDEDKAFEAKMKKLCSKGIKGGNGERRGRKKKKIAGLDD